MWVEILLDKYASQRFDRLNGCSSFLAIVGGWICRRARWPMACIDWNHLFRGLYEARIARSRISSRGFSSWPMKPQWLVFVAKEGKIVPWLVALGLVGSAEDMAVYILDASRAVMRFPRTHYFPQKPAVFFLVDRYSAYKAMAQGEEWWARIGLLFGLTCAARLRASGQELA